jgi:hypothetical protein
MTSRHLGISADSSPIYLSPILCMTVRDRVSCVQVCHAMTDDICDDMTDDICDDMTDDICDDMTVQDGRDVL